MGDDGAAPLVGGEQVIAALLFEKARERAEADRVLHAFDDALQGALGSMGVCERGDAVECAPERRGAALPAVCERGGLERRPGVGVVGEI